MIRANRQNNKSDISIKTCPQCACFLEKPKNLNQLWLTNILYVCECVCVCVCVCCVLHNANCKTISKQNTKKNKKKN